MAPKPEPAAPATPAARLLAEAEQKYADKDWVAAKQAFSRALQASDDKPVHGRAYYGLARIAALEKDPELAERLFQKTLELAADPALQSWARLYLGRLAGSRGDRAEAETQWKAILAIAGAPDQVRQLAENDLRKLKDKE
jgi:tetratricopeptide (TPR) repeat protein